MDEPISLFTRLYAEAGMAQLGALPKIGRASCRERV